MLAVEDEHRGGKITQLADRRRTTVDQRPRAAFGGDAARKHKLLRIGGNPFAQFRAQLVAHLKDPFDISLVGPRPDDSGPWPATEQQIKRVRENRLACPGLSREDVEPRREPQLSAFDQQKIFDSQLVKHCFGLAARGDGLGLKLRAPSHS